MTRGMKHATNVQRRNISDGKVLENSTDNSLFAVFIYPKFSYIYSRFFRFLCDSDLCCVKGVYNKGAQIRGRLSFMRWSLMFVHP